MKTILDTATILPLKGNVEIDLMCENCSKVFKGDRKLVKHEILHPKGKMRFCTRMCQGNFQSKYEMRHMECRFCKKQMNLRRAWNSKNDFCSRRCYQWYRQTLADIKKYRPKNIFRTCHKCGLTYRRFKTENGKYFKSHLCQSCQHLVHACVPILFSRKVKAEYKEMVCTQCGSHFSRNVKELKKSKHQKFFCSKSCRMKWYNENVKINTSCRRSYTEDILADKIRKSFPKLELRCNDRKTVGGGLELDLYMPSLKLAIELNGPFHYQPKFGDERLKYVQGNDIKKSISCQNQGIRLMVIDTSMVRSKKQIEGFCQKLWDEKIRPLLSEMVAPIGLSPITYRV